MFAINKPFYPDFSISEAVQNNKHIALIRERIHDGQIVIFKGFADRNEISALKNYLHNIQRSSLPEFIPIKEGAKNNYRINFEDDRSPVKAFFHVWSFYKWNQDPFLLYNRYEDVYRLRNLIAGLDSETFLKNNIDYDCAARLSVQFYPKGKGYFSAHEDPYDIHQLVVPIMAMSQKGVDFDSGGNFVRTSKDSIIDTEELVEPGDIILFNSLCEHGVNKIDENNLFDPMSDEGRWMMLFAVNKTINNKTISDAVER